MFWLGLAIGTIVGGVVGLFISALLVVSEQDRNNR